MYRNVVRDAWPYLGIRLTVTPISISVRSVFFIYSICIFTLEQLVRLLTELPSNKNLERYGLISL